MDKAQAKTPAEGNARAVPMTWATLRPWAGTAGIVAGLVVVYYLLPLSGLWVVGLLGWVAVVVGLGPLAVYQVRRILASPRPLAATGRAIAVLLVVAVVGFASTYYALEAHSPSQMVGLTTKTDALYFTVTVLATVGFGDVHPEGQAARVIATVHMVFNLVLVAVAVRGVTWAARRRVAAVDAVRHESSP